MEMGHHATLRCLVLGFGWGSDGAFSEGQAPSRAKTDASPILARPFPPAGASKDREGPGAATSRGDWSHYSRLTLTFGDLEYPLGAGCFRRAVESWQTWRRQPRPRRRRCNIKVSVRMSRGQEGIHCVLPVDDLVPHFHQPTTLCTQPSGPFYPPRPLSSASRLPPSASQDDHAAGPLSLNVRLRTLWAFAKPGARVKVLHSPGGQLGRWERHFRFRILVVTGREPNPQRPGRLSLRPTDLVDTRTSIPPAKPTAPRSMVGLHGTGVANEPRGATKEEDVWIQIFTTSRCI